MSHRHLRVVALALLTWPFAGVAGPALIWSDDFNLPVGSAPDSARWVHDLGAGGWGNRELQTYTASRENSVIVADPGALDGRALAIHARRAPDGGYTSARLKTEGKFSVTYGRIEARMKLTRGRGVWPAFWMLGANKPAVGWPACGEIDIMEQVGHEPGKLHGTLHGPGYSGAKGLNGHTTLLSGASLSDAYHVYAVDWSPGKISWSLDGTVYLTRTPADLPAGTRWVFDSPQYLLLNLAVGGHWPGSPDATTVFPQTLLIDYVRVYGHVAAPPVPN
ncbi:MAG: glycoside hydrolase family 16 protein [Opitutaceae bacterium]|nr:glycoside hydrolase family 16 protein [Opitutaceae bacterium]